MSKAAITKAMTGKLATAFNEWQRRYVADPDQFARDFEEAGRFAAERAQGKTPTYGMAAAAYLSKLIAEVRP